MRRNELSSRNKQTPPKKDWPVVRPVPLCAKNSTNQELRDLLRKADPTKRDDLEKVSALLSDIWKNPNKDFDVIEKAQSFIRTAHQFQGRSRWEG